MKALVFSGVRNVECSSIPDPELKAETDVILQVELGSICGSDLHPYHGREKGLDLGTVMGHEAVGTIAAVGTAVKKLKVGDRVFGPFTTNCGVCYFCRIGLTCRCETGQLYGWVENGRGLQGLQAERARIPLADSTLLKLPPGISPEVALFLGDIFSTGYYCAEMAEVSSSGTYAVLGCGPVGLAAILACKTMGAARVFAVDSIRKRLEKAEQFGATPIELSQQDVKEVILKVTDGRGADSVIEAVGSYDAQKLAMECLRPGGILSVPGVHTGTTFSFSPVQAYDKNLTYKTGRCPARHYMEKLLPLVTQEKNAIETIITHRFPLSEGREAYHTFDEKRDGCIKAMLTF